MKKIILFLSVFSILIFTSCGDNDDAPVVPTVGLNGTIDFDGESYAIANGVFTQSMEDGNAIGVFYMSDGTIELNASGNGVTSSNSRIVISINATSKGTSTLENGSYETSTLVPDKYASVRVSTVNNSMVVNNDSVVGGEVAVSGSENTYNITFNDIPFGRGVKLTGSVNGTYAN